MLDRRRTDVGAPVGLGQQQSKPGPADPKSERRRVSTKIVDDVFTDSVDTVRPHFTGGRELYVERLWQAGPEVHGILRAAADLEAAREGVYEHLSRVERELLSCDNELHILEKALAREAIRVLRSIIGPTNESRTGVSALHHLWRLARGTDDDEASVGFLLEFINLMRAVGGRSGIYTDNGRLEKGVPLFLELQGREAALARMEILDQAASDIGKYFRRYPSGLDDQVVAWRAENRARILRAFGGTESDWSDYRWQLKNVVRDGASLLDLVEVTAEQRDSIAKAAQYRIPFGITPYYLSLMDSKLSIGFDHAIRAQVIPPKEYVDRLAADRDERGVVFDFMGEHDTSPIDLVTRRYPGIAIIKPFNTCAQICVYCQRNWEIEGVLEPTAAASRETLDQAVRWVEGHPGIRDVLVTGGDPAVMNDDQIGHLLGELAEIPHVRRIRIGTRTPVVLPMRWTAELVALLAKHHEPPRREVAVVTHFEHPYEVTPEAMAAIQGIRRAGLSVYNQEVFTVENSRRFETAKLRLDLKSIGVDPYYTFNMKGKDETRRYMVPIARLLQERKEEARLLPGLDRTDEPVFNVPRLGKNHLRAWQDHRLVMIRPDGARVYELHPWEKNISPVPPYNYVDVPIYDYLEEMAARGENLRDYRTIWFYY